MFSPAPMVQVRALVLQRDERRLLYALGRAGVVHLSRAESPLDATLRQALDRSDELARCADLLRRIDGLRRAGEPLEGTTHAGQRARDQIPDHTPGHTRDQAAEQAAEQTADQAERHADAARALDEIQTRLAQLETDMAETSRRRAQLAQSAAETAELLDQIADYRALDLPFGKLEGATFLHFAIGSLPSGNLDRLLRSTAGDGGRSPDAALPRDVLLWRLRPVGDRQPIVAMASRRSRAALGTALQGAGFVPQRPPFPEGCDLDSLAQETRARQARAIDELAGLDDARWRANRSIDAELARLEHAVRCEQLILRAEDNFERTQRAVLIAGWVPVDQADALAGQLRDTTAGRCAINTLSADHVPLDQIPILLRQPRWLRPFGALVTGYGWPGYRDVEPTLFVAISYLLMFGIMFGDVGHGAILALAGLAMMFAGRGRRPRGYGLVVAAAGVSSVLFGSVYGSVFGIPALHRYGLWHDPLHDPIRLMVAAIGVGVLMISLGVILNIVNAWRRGDLVHAVLDKFGLAGALVYWASLVLIVRAAAFNGLGSTGAILLGLIAALLVAISLKEPLDHVLSKRAGRAPPASGIGMALLESAIEAFEALLAFLANTISFVRLAAYAMSHAAILVATFAVAEAIGRTPTVGDALYVAVAVGGNAVALILEGVVVAVQVLRLEYYEFFGKFFSGSGAPFTPFAFSGVEREVS